MNCNDVRNGIYVYLDGEFAQPERGAFEGHISACAACRALVEAERHFLTVIRERKGAEAAPEGLRDRIEATLAITPIPRTSKADPRRAAQWRTWLIAAPVALAAALLLVFSGSLRPSGADHDAEEAVVRAAVAAHRNDLPVEVRGSGDEIRKYLQDNARFAVQIPIQEGGQVQLVGARLTQMNDASAVVFNYRLGEHRFSVVQLPSVQPPGAGDDALRFDDQQGYRVVTYRQRGLTNSLVADMDDGELSRLVPAVYRHGD